jgi:hypothetical protein
MLLDRTFADAKTQLEQFTPDTFSSPQSIVPCHLLDQSHGLWGDPWFGRSCPTLILPKELEALPMPPQEPLWLNDEKCLLPGPNHPCQKQQKHPIRFVAGWSFHLSTQDEKLLSEQRVFCHEFGLAPGRVRHSSQ